MIVVLPFLLFLLFGIVEISRLFYWINIVTTASRDGARVAAASGSLANGDVRIQEILNAGPSGLLGDVTPSPWVTCSPATCDAGSAVTAKVTATFRTQIPLIGSLVPALDSFPIEGTTIMRRE